VRHGTCGFGRRWYSGSQLTAHSLAVVTQLQPPRAAIASGGPMDGSHLGASNVEEYQVTMADGSRHRYARTDVQTERGLFYDYAGRV
jgi:hypothetical protein